MGIGVSSWELAGAVARTGNLGVVSGTALEHVYARRLQLGDPGGHVRRALAAFPVPDIAARVLERYFVPGGKPAGAPFRGVPMFTVTPPPALVELTVVANFAEVTLARERGAGGPIGINYLYKIQLPLLAALYGAMLARVDDVLVGAGNPEQIPALMSDLARGRDVALALKVQYGGAAGDARMAFSPRALLGEALAPVPRPRLLAIVASVDLARALCEDPRTRPDGFVVEGPTAGGHNAPPRGPLRLDAEGQPLYGPLDEVDLAAMAALGPPFWLAGSYGSPEALQRARDAGAAGVQVGTAFAFCRESGLTAELKARVLDGVRRGSVSVFTDRRASPTGFPFKVLRVAGALSDSGVYAARPRVCDVGCLRMPFRGASGELGYLCPAEAERIFVRKGGRAQNLEGRKCLCNSLLANVGLGQVRPDGSVEPPLLTAGDDLQSLGRFVSDEATSYGAADVVRALLPGSAGPSGSP